MMIEENSDDVNLVKGEQFFIPAQETDFTESFTEALNKLMTKLKKHPRCQKIISHAAYKLAKFIECIPDLQPLTLDRDLLRNRLSTIITGLINLADESFTLNEIFGFHSFNEHLFVFRSANSFINVTLPQFSLILQDLCRYLEHTFAKDLLIQLDDQIGKECSETPLFANFKFNGFNMAYFFKVKILIERLVRANQSLDEVTRKLAEVDLLVYLKTYFSMDSLFKLTRTIPDYFSKCNMFSKLDGYSVFRIIPELAPLDWKIIQIPKEEIFNVGGLYERIKCGNKPQVQNLENFPLAITHPSEKDQQNYSIQLAYSLFMCPEFLGDILKMASMCLRLSTSPTIEGRTEISIYHRDYPLKRLISINPKKANCMLLYKLLKEQGKNLFEIEIDHLKNKTKFKTAIIEMLKRGFHIEESELLKHSDEIKRFNRRWNKIYERASIIFVDRFIELYLGFYFDQAVQRSYAQKSLKSFMEIHQALFVYPTWRLVDLPELRKKDSNFCVYEKYANIIAEINLVWGTVSFSFWKGMRLYEEHRFQIQGIHYEKKSIEITGDGALKQLITDFAPHSLVIIANCKEAYFLRKNIGYYTEYCSGESSKQKNYIDFFVYFIHSPLLECLAKTETPKAKVYNMYMQNPLLTFLCLFDRLQKPESIFSKSKFDLSFDFNIFMLKLALIECLLEKGLSIRHLIDSCLAQNLIKLLGFRGSLSDLQLISLAETEENNRSRKHWMNFVAGKAPHSALVLINQKFELENLYETLKSKMEIGEGQHLATYVEAVTKILDYEKSNQSLNQRNFIQTICPNTDIYTACILIRQILVQFKVIPNRKMRYLMYKLSSAKYEIKTAISIFKNEINLKNFVVVPLIITKIDDKYVMGRIGRFFSGALYIDDIGNKTFQNKSAELANYFSINQAINVIITDLHPTLLRINVSISSKDIHCIKDYITVHGVLKRYQIEPGANFFVDFKRDVPFVSEFEKIERNFDYFAVENPALKNLSLINAKSYLRNNKVDGYLFKPSQRNKSSYFDLVIYFAKVDFHLVIPISLGSLADGETPKLNTSPKKYIRENLETLNFIWEKCSFDGLSKLINDFVIPLQANFNKLLNHENFTTLSKSSIKQSCENFDNMANQPTEEEVIFKIQKHPTDEFKFKLYYKDGKNIFGNKVLSLDHSGFTLLKKYDKLEDLFKDFQTNSKSEQFLHPTDRASSESLLSVLSDSDSIVSVVSMGGESNANPKGSLKAKQRGALQTHNIDGDASYSNDFVRNNSEFGNQRSNRGGLGGSHNRNFTPRNNDAQKKDRFGERNNNYRDQTNRESFDKQAGNAVPSWGNQNIQSSNDIPTWGNVLNQVSCEVPSWGTKTAQPSNNVPTWGNTSNQVSNEVQSWGTKNTTSTWEKTGIDETKPTWGNQSTEFKNDAPSWGNSAKNTVNDKFATKNPTSETKNDNEKLDLLNDKPEKPTWGPPIQTDTNPPISDTSLPQEHDQLEGKAKEPWGKNSHSWNNDTRNFQNNQSQGNFKNQNPRHNENQRRNFGVDRKQDDRPFNSNKVSRSPEQRSYRQNSWNDSKNSNSEWGNSQTNQTASFSNNPPTWGSLNKEKASEVPTWGNPLTEEKKENAFWGTSTNTEPEKSAWEAPANQECGKSTWGNPPENIAPGGTAPVNANSNQTWNQKNEGEKSFKNSDNFSNPRFDKPWGPKNNDGNNFKGQGDNDFRHQSRNFGDRNNRQSDNNRFRGPNRFDRNTQENPNHGGNNRYSNSRFQTNRDQIYQQDGQNQPKSLNNPDSNDKNSWENQKPANPVSAWGVQPTTNNDPPTWGNQKSNLTENDSCWENANPKAIDATPRWEKPFSKEDEKNSNAVFGAPKNVESMPTWGDNRQKESTPTSTWGTNAGTNTTWGRPSENDSWTNRDNNEPQKQVSEASSKFQFQQRDNYNQGSREGFGNNTRRDFNQRGDRPPRNNYNQPQGGQDGFQNQNSFGRKYQNYNQKDNFGNFRNDGNGPRTQFNRGQKHQTDHFSKAENAQESKDFPTWGNSSQNQSFDGPTWDAPAQVTGNDKNCLDNPANIANPQPNTWGNSQSCQNIETTGWGTPRIGSELNSTNQSRNEWDNQTKNAESQINEPLRNQSPNQFRYKNQRNNEGAQRFSRNNDYRSFDNNDNRQGRDGNRQHPQNRFQGNRQNDSRGQFNNRNNNNFRDNNRQNSQSFGVTSGNNTSNQGNSSWGANDNNKDSAPNWGTNSQTFSNPPTWGTNAEKSPINQPSWGANINNPLTISANREDFNTSSDQKKSENEAWGNLITTDTQAIGWNSNNSFANKIPNPSNKEVEIAPILSPRNNESKAVSNLPTWDSSKVQAKTHNQNDSWGQETSINPQKSERTPTWGNNTSESELSTSQRKKDNKDSDFSSIRVNSSSLGRETDCAEAETKPGKRSSEKFTENIEFPVKSQSLKHVKERMISSGNPQDSEPEEGEIKYK